MSKVLVTAPDSYVGQRLLAALADAGHAAAPLETDGGEAEALTAQLSGAACVVHAAPMAGDERHATAALTAAAAGAGLPRLVVLGRAEIYGAETGRGPAPLSEQSPSAADGTDPSGKQAMAVEEAVTGQPAPPEVVLFRVPTVHGPGAPEPAALFERWLTQGPGSVPARRLHWIHVDDLARAVVAAVESEAPAGGTFNVAGPDAVLNILLRDHVYQMAMALTAGPDDDAHAHLDRRTAPSVFDTRRAEATFGWAADRSIWWCLGEQARPVIRRLAAASTSASAPPDESGGPQDAETEMSGKVCVITGATSGIGRECALNLAIKGAEVVIIGRREVEGRALVAEIDTFAGVPRAHFMRADLSSLAEVRRLAAAIQARWPRIDVLINNASAIFGTRRETQDGIEATLAVNYLSHFLLTNLLLPALQAAPEGRVVNVASEHHRRTTLDFGDLQATRDYHGPTQYGLSKLAMVLFTYDLARRLGPGSIDVVALHPALLDASHSGLVATGIGLANDGFAERAWDRIIARAMRAEEASRLLEFAASSPTLRGASGVYLRNGQPTMTSQNTYDAGTAQRMWEISTRLTGLSEDAVA